MVVGYLRRCRARCSCCASSRHGRLDPSATIFDASVARRLRDELAGEGCWCVGGRLGCCSLHPDIPFSQSKSVRTPVRLRSGGRCETLTAAACRFRSRAMPPDLFCSLDSFVYSPAADAALIVRGVAGDYRLADADEVLVAAQHLLARRMRGGDVLNAPGARLCRDVPRNHRAGVCVSTGSDDGCSADEKLVRRAGAQPSPWPCGSVACRRSSDADVEGRTSADRRTGAGSPDRGRPHGI